MNTFNPDNLFRHDYEISDNVVMAEVNGRYFPILERMGVGTSSFVFRTIHIEFRSEQYVDQETENSVLNEIQAQLLLLYADYFEAKITEFELRSQIASIADQVGLSIRDAVFKVYKPADDVDKIAMTEQKQHLAIWSRRSNIIIPDIHPGPVLKVRLTDRNGMIDSTVYAIEMVKIDLTDEGMLLKNWVPDGMDNDKVVTGRGNESEIAGWAKKTFNVFTSQIGPAYYNMFLHGVANSDISPFNLGVGKENAILFDFAHCKVVKFNLANALILLDHLHQTDPAKAILLASRIFGTLGKLDPALRYGDQFVVLKEGETLEETHTDKVVMENGDQVADLQAIIVSAKNLYSELNKFGVTVLQDMFHNPRFNMLERKLHSSLWELDNRLKDERDRAMGWLGLTDRSIVTIHPYSTNLSRLDTADQSFSEMINTLDEVINLVRSCLEGRFKSNDSAVNDKSITMNEINSGNQKVWEKGNTLSRILRNRLPQILLAVLNEFGFSTDDLEELISIYDYHKAQLGTYNSSEAAAYYELNPNEIGKRYGNLDFTQVMKDLISNHGFKIPWGEIPGLQFIEPYQLGYTPSVGNPVFPMQVFNSESFNDYLAANIYGLVALFLDQIGAPYHVTFLDESKTRTAVTTKDVVHEENSGFWKNLLSKTIDSFYIYLDSFDSREYPFVPQEVFVDEMLNSKYSRLRFLRGLEDGEERLKALHSLFEDFFRSYYDVFFLRYTYPDDQTSFLRKYMDITKFFEEAYSIIFGSPIEA